ncbi:hypothetical protein HYFRA_00012364 [Hymenoscyphus fraxineus]|uniref:Uncharacterized protein n=1 Tax=Hymenoscyphus fraxineus TaxID=746836 RepID=A0A9N9KZU9_9HELO|nr:hypothetical protein HYFRA_00012364 [Hymenoscyphus fraxineus]
MEQRDKPTGNWRLECEAITIVQIHIRIGGDQLCLQALAVGSCRFKRDVQTLLGIIVVALRFPPGNPNGKELRDRTRKG